MSCIMQGIDLMIAVVPELYYLSMFQQTVFLAETLSTYSTERLVPVQYRALLCHHWLF